MAQWTILLFFLYGVLHGQEIQPPTVQECCQDGRNRALRGQDCTILPLISHSHTCRIVQEQCCAAAVGDRLCDNGVKMAKGQGACERPFFQGDPWETRISKMCCDCCMLGLMTPSQDSSCELQGLLLGRQCAQTAKTCCGKDTTEENKPTASGGGSTKRPSAAPGTPPPAMTSGNESEAPPTVTGSTPQNGENKPPQAIVKPQVLTHVIEGFVIQEGAEPFPVCVERLPILIDSPKKLDHQLSSDPDKTPVSNAANTDSEPEDMTEKDQEPKLTCEYCGWVDFAYTFKGSKRFCSMVCAKRYNVGCTKRIGLFRPERSKPTNRWRRRSPGRSSIEAKKQKLSPSPQQTQGGSVSSPHPSQPSQEDSSPCSDMSSYEEPPSPLSAASSGPLAPAPVPAQVPVHRHPSRASDQEGCVVRDSPSLCQRFLPNDPTKWNVEEVYEFIRSLPGCQEIADEFRSQEIDGQALLLLKEDHLMSTMNIKLGPALKIFARINMLKDS